MILPLLILILMASCDNGYDIYKDSDDSFYPIMETPDVYVVLNTKRATYYKIIHFNSYWELEHPGYASSYNTKIEAGFHLADNEGYNGYDFSHTYKSLNGAIQAAEQRGSLYQYHLGYEYQFHDGFIYRSSPFKKLRKD